MLGMEIEPIPASERDRILECYKENGIAVIRNAISDSEVEELNELMDEELEEHPERWHPPDQGVIGNTHLMKKRPQIIDEYIRHPNTLPVVKEILGEEVRFGRWDIREITPERAESSDMSEHWFHRDTSFYADVVGGHLYDPRNPYNSTLTCTIHYLKDVDDCCPCFSFVPNSHTYGSHEEAKEQLDDYTEIDIRADAGTAILYNITDYHTRKAGTQDCSHGRRTMHTYYSSEKTPPMMKWYTLPEELAMSDDPETKWFYSQWSPDQIEYAREHYDQEVPDYYPEVKGEIPDVGGDS